MINDTMKHILGTAFFNNNNNIIILYIDIDIDIDIDIYIYIGRRFNSRNQPVQKQN